MVYQEQVMQIAQTMGGYSLGGADLLRRAMGKKIRAEMDAQRQTFVDGATGARHPGSKARRGVRPDGEVRRLRVQQVARRRLCAGVVPDRLDEANHPVEFLAACMSLAINNTDKLAALRQEAERLGIRVLPPDINRSGADFTVDVDARRASRRSAMRWRR